jgi:hypothetical protein
MRSQRQRLMATAGIGLVMLCLGVRDAAAQQSPSGRSRASITVPKAQFAAGERFRACFTYPSPASVIVAQASAGLPAHRIYRRFVGDRRATVTTERRSCIRVTAGATHRWCTHDTAGLEATPCVAGTSVSECLHLAVLTPLGRASDGVQMVEEDRACYLVG